MLMNIFDIILFLTIAMSHDGLHRKIFSLLGCYKTLKVAISKNKAQMKELLFNLFFRFPHQVSTHLNF
jgi:hypothetical protein